MPRGHSKGGDHLQPGGGKAPGPPEADVMTDNIMDFYPYGQAKVIMKDLRSAEYGGPGLLEKREFLLLDKNGWEIPVYISASILYDEDKEIGSVGVFTDLREKRELKSAPADRKFPWASAADRSRSTSR
jgi:hypothetical protein